MKIQYKRPRLESDHHKIVPYEEYSTSINTYYEKMGYPLHSEHDMKNMYKTYFEMYDNINAEIGIIDSIDIDARDYDTTIKNLADLHKTIEVIHIFND